MITEKDIEQYLVKQSTDMGALVRKVQWVGHNHCPDRLIMTNAISVWVEVKAPGKAPRPGQEREHQRMRRVSQKVITIDSKDGVDQFIKELREVNCAY